MTNVKKTVICILLLLIVAFNVTAAKVPLPIEVFEDTSGDLKTITKVYEFESSQTDESIPKKNFTQDGVEYALREIIEEANQEEDMSICVKTERADIGSYIRRHEAFSQNEQNEATIAMIYDEMNFVKSLSENVAVKKRFYIIFEYTPRVFGNSSFKFDDVLRQLSDEAYKAQRYLSQCELGVIDITDDGQLIDLFYGFINKQSSKYVNPGNFARGMFDEIHTFEGGENSE